jgi:hypothetical protein
VPSPGGGGYAAMATTREATFAGFLGFEDYQVTGLGTDSPLVAISVRTGTPPGAKRSRRPFAIASHSWLTGDAELGIEDTGRKFAAEHAVAAGEDLPGDALEAWLLPVLGFRLDYLITPAGDWPAP